MPQSAPPPATDVYLAPLSGSGSALTIGTPVNVSNSPEYDNQPSFLPDGSAILFTSRRDGRQTDIYRYDIKTTLVTQLTRTAENEYSALVTPDGRTFSTVRGDKQELCKTVSFIGRPPGAPAVVKELDTTTKRTTVLTAGLPGSQYLTWLPDGGMLMASGTKISSWRDGAPGWTEVGDVASAALTKISRLSASPDGKWLAFVAEPHPK